MKLLVALMVSIVFLTGGFAYAETAGFDDLALDPESFYNGSDAAGGFESGGVFFNNLFDDTYGPYWEGFAFTNTTDTTTLDFTNQYSAITGSGAGGSSNYGVGYTGFYGIVPAVTFPKEVMVAKANITNTTYVFLAMQEGYFNAKKFGGDEGDDEDWFLLTITGKDADGTVKGTVEFYLADFRFPDNSQDYIVNEWMPVALSGLGPVKSLEFLLSSSDNDPVYGMNTPAYFAVDTIVFSFMDVDDDGDGFNDNEGDCNDDDDSVYPGAADICGDGIDQDCDGSDAACPEDDDDDDNISLGCFINSVR